MLLGWESTAVSRHASPGATTLECVQRSSGVSTPAASFPSLAPPLRLLKDGGKIHNVPGSFRSRRPQGRADRLGSVWVAGPLLSICVQGRRLLLRGLKEPAEA